MQLKKSVKGIRYLLLMRRDNVRAEKLPRLDEALKHNEPLLMGYLLKEALGRDPSPCVHLSAGVLSAVARPTAAHRVKNSGVEFDLKTGASHEHQTILDLLAGKKT